MSLARFVRRLGRYNRIYFRNKAYDSPIRNSIESGIDSRRLRKVYPDLQKSFDSGKVEYRHRLLPFYEDYIRNVSNEIMAVSLELSTFLSFFCGVRKPTRILDLGSGFSSFVLRLHKSEASPEPEVWSVDDSSEWLEKTRSFLMKRRVSDKNLMTWDTLVVSNPGRFDFILYDLGDFDFRRDSFDRVLQFADENGVVIVDDMHSANYGLYVRKRLNDNKWKYFNLHHFTNDKYGRYSLLIQR